MKAAATTTLPVPERCLAERPSKVVLTDVSVRALKAPAFGQMTVWDKISPLGIRISSGGAKTFIVMVGSGRQQTIGKVAFSPFPRRGPKQSERSQRRHLDLLRSLSRRLPVRDGRRFLHRRELSRSQTTHKERGETAARSPFRPGFPEEVPFRSYRRGHRPPAC